MKEIVDAINNRRCVVFAGAGISKMTVFDFAERV